MTNSGYKRQVPDRPRCIGSYENEHSDLVTRFVLCRTRGILSLPGESCGPPVLIERRRGCIAYIAFGRWRPFGRRSR